MNLGKETETVEFKKTTGELKEAVVSISAILNKHGVGTLYFGVKPNGVVCGQSVSESSLRDVSRAVSDHIRPQIYPVIEEIVLEDKHLIKVEFNGSDTPYSAMGKYYLRTADEDREVTPKELRNFFIANEYKEKWENTATGVTLNQADKRAVKEFWQKAVSVGRMIEGRYSSSAVLKRYGLNRENFLNNAGEHLFGNTKPVTLKAAIFATDKKLTFLDIKLFEDNIYRLLEISEEYILKNIRWHTEIVSRERKEIPEIPVALIREVIANSFAHAAYNENTNHEICIHPGKITVYNPGSYASQYMPEEYVKKNLESVIRNSKIAKILYLNKSIEQFGSGFKRIDALANEAKIKYSYENNAYGFKFIIYRKKIQSDKIDALNSTEIAVKAMLEHDNTFSRADIADKISKSVRTVQRALDSLKEKRIIERLGSKQKPIWRVL